MALGSVTKKRTAVTALVWLAAFSFADGIPALTKPVMDTAGIVADDKEAELDTYLTAVSQQTGVQVAVLTIPTLNNQPLESFSREVAESWRLGQEKENNGVLLTVALQEHQLRIETGYGVEGLLTDTKCGLIIRNEMTPYFKNGDYTQGIINGVMRIVDIATEGADIDTALQQTEERTDWGDILGVGWFIFVILMMITTQAGIGPLGMYWWYSLLTGTPFVRHYPKSSGTGGSLHGGGFSSGGFSHSGFSGGFHGGGGHFGGGGASGRW